MNQQMAPTPGANGQSTLDDIFVLTDEQLLEIDPQPQDAAVRSDSSAEEVNVAGLPDGQAQADFSSASPTRKASAENAPAEGDAHRSLTEHGTRNTEHAAPTDHAASTSATPTAPFAKPEELRAVAELYPGGITQAKTAADRARLLDDIDRAYFGAQGNTPEQTRTARAQLAATMLREDPVAFREMVFEGLRALEQAGGPPPVAAVFRPRGLDANGAPASSAAANASVVGATLGSPAGERATTASGRASSAPTGLGNHQTPQPGAVEHQAHLAAYAEFERAANADLEKSVGGAIDRALQQALPNLERAGEHVSGQAPHAVPLQTRLRQAIREDVERALQSDRQLGEQVAQILAARRFDHETRAQVVRLINDRALQLVPVAAKHALNDWTQATLAAHRSRTTRSEATASRREVAPASLPANPGGSQQRALAHPLPAQAGFRGEAPARSGAQTPRAGAHTAGKGRVDYRKLSDEQILNL